MAPKANAKAKAAAKAKATAKAKAAVPGVPAAQLLPVIQGMHFPGTGSFPNTVFGAISRKRAYHFSLECAQKSVKARVVEFDLSLAQADGRNPCKRCLYLGMQASHVAH